MALLPSGRAGSGSEEQRASLTWIGGHTAGNGEREREKHYNRTHLSITDREERE